VRGPASTLVGALARRFRPAFAPVPLSPHDEVVVEVVSGRHSNLADVRVRVDALREAVIAAG
jgi:hypothetical protein